MHIAKWQFRLRSLNLTTRRRKIILILMHLAYILFVYIWIRNNISFPRFLFIFLLANLYLRQFYCEYRRWFHDSTIDTFLFFSTIITFFSTSFFNVYLIYVTLPLLTCLSLDSRDLHIFAIKVKWEFCDEDSEKLFLQKRVELKTNLLLWVILY